VLDFDIIGFIFRVISDNKHPQGVVYQSHTRSDKEIFGQDEAALFLCQDEAALGVVESQYCP
jgi:hypothetical protein